MFKQPACALIGITTLFCAFCAHYILMPVLFLYLFDWAMTDPGYSARVLMRGRNLAGAAYEGAVFGVVVSELCLVLPLILLGSYFTKAGTE